MLFPNLTAAFTDEQMGQTEDEEGVACDYDNIITDTRISLPLSGGDEEMGGRLS